MLRSTLNSMIDDLAMAQNNLYKDHAERAENAKERIYRRLSNLLAERQRRLNQCTKSESKAKSKYPTHREDLDNE
ncbi:hypothetical protein B0186_06535 [Canicola haemoglobinophilus]|nr:hypothetical protein B0186_06535 [Canicola haemoglobinophilus]